MPRGAAKTNLRWAESVYRSQLSANARHVCVCIALEYADFDTLRDIRPGAPRLARATGLSESTVYRALHELVDAKWLVRVKNGGERCATLYRGRFPPRVTDSGSGTAWAGAGWTCETCGGYFPSNADALIGWTLATGENVGKRLGDCTTAHNKQLTQLDAATDAERRDRHAARLLRADIDALHGGPQLPVEC